MFHFYDETTRTIKYLRAVWIVAGCTQFQTEVLTDLHYERLSSWIMKKKEEEEEEEEKEDGGCKI
jgi:hypothetical protein